MVAARRKLRAGLDACVRALVSVCTAAGERVPSHGPTLELWIASLDDDAAASSAASSAAHGQEAERRRVDALALLLAAVRAAYDHTPPELQRATIAAALPAWLRQLPRCYGALLAPGAAATRLSLSLIHI